MHKLTLFASLALMMCSVAPMHADVLSVTTSKAVGEKVTIAMDGDIDVTFKWGDGSSETVASSGKPTEYTVKNQNLSIESDDAITYFYAPSDGITAIDASGATNLLRLICPDNQLSNLDLTANTALVELDCSSNKLAALDVKKNTKLLYLDCAQNALTDLAYATTTKFKTLVCANNQLDTLKTTTRWSALEGLWCQNNKLRALQLQKSPELTTLVASNNQLENVTFTGMPNLTSLFLDGNKLTTLDLSNGTESLKECAVDGNELNDIAWTWAGGDKVTYFYAENNKLFFSDLVSPKAAVKGYGVAPQRAHKLSKEAIGATDPWNMESELGYSADGLTVAANATFADANGALALGTDYTVEGTAYTFLVQRNGVVMTATSELFPDVTLTTEPFDVTDLSGVDVASLAKDLTISTAAGELHITLAAPGFVRVDNVAGVNFVFSNMAEGSHTWSLPAGLYIVNGKKIVIP